MQLKQAPEFKLFWDEKNNEWLLDLTEFIGKVMFSGNKGKWNIIRCENWEKMSKSD